MVALLCLMSGTLLAADTKAAMQQKTELMKQKAKVDPYLLKVKAQPDWLYSRLQMYWTTHATDVYVNAETFDHPGGNRAPVPTVKFNGTRGGASAYSRPPLEQVTPYDDDQEGSVTEINRTTGAIEKVHPSKTACNIASINHQIMSIAKDAAAVYKATGDTMYARMAFDVFDTYLKGIYYRNVPIDLSHGHMQTLVGMQTFEVIHEECLADACAIYAHLKDYIRQDRTLYDAALKKWAENIIDNGVPHNNWDLFQAELITEVALVLGDDAAYADKKGRQYYLDYVLNQNSVRQWSMKKLADFGYDCDTNIWYESPGYSITVMNDFSHFVTTMDTQAGIDLVKEVPQIPKAIMVSPQYLTPNRMFCGFGDSHPTYLNPQAADNMIAYAQRHANVNMERDFTQLKRAIQPDASVQEIEKYVSPSFYAKNVSWLVQRTGMNIRHDLMASLNGSLGNHQHANGISLELYGKGYVLGPDGGIGKNLYSGDDYKEYYSQFPAHNTVCVDGVSTYAVMMSQHPFQVEERYPADNKTFGEGVQNEGAQNTSAPSNASQREGVSYSVLSFIEPETISNQQRTTGIVKTSVKGGYYVDIFRSKRQAGGDKYHDYFYHNLGQRMQVNDTHGHPLDMTDTDELAFAGGHLYAYSYLYQKKGAQMKADVKAQFTIDVKNKDKDKNNITNTTKSTAKALISDTTITMNMWMRHDANRQVFQCLSPVNMQYERMPNQPYNIIQQPVLTFVARQKGEAWNHPFVAVYEPTSNTEPSEIASVTYFTPKSSDASAVGICVKLKSGRTDYIFSASSDCEMRYKKMKVKGRYAVVSDHFKLEKLKYIQR